MIKPKRLTDLRNLSLLMILLIIANCIPINAVPTKDIGNNDNINPVINLSVTPAKKPVDIVILTDYTGTKLTALNTQINALKAQFNAVNVDPRFHIISDIKKVGTHDDKLYTFSRYARYTITLAYRKVWRTVGNTSPDFQEIPYIGKKKSLLEERQGLLSQYPNLPVRNPNNVSLKKVYFDNKKEWTRQKGYDCTLTWNNDAPGVVTKWEFFYETYFDDWWNYYTETYGSFVSEEYSVDNFWSVSTTFTPVTYDVYSLDFSKLNSLPLRSGSDRHMIFLSDAAEKDYSQPLGGYFFFGDLTAEVENYIKTNNFSVYGVLPDKAIDRTFALDKIIDMFPLANGTDAFYYMKNGTILEPVAYDGFSTFKEIQGSMPLVKDTIRTFDTIYFLMMDGTIKYYDSSTKKFQTLPGITNAVKAYSYSNYSNTSGLRFYKSRGLHVLDNKGKIYFVNINKVVKPFNNTVAITDIYNVCPGSDIYGGNIYVTADGVPYMEYPEQVLSRALINNNGVARNLPNIDYAAYFLTMEPIPGTRNGYARSYSAVVLYKTGKIQQFTNFSYMDVGGKTYYSFFEDTAVSVNEANVKRIESNGTGCFIFKTDGTIKLLNFDWIPARYKESDREGGYDYYDYEAPVHKNTLINVPLTNVKDTYNDILSDTYFFTLSDDSVYAYSGGWRSVPPVIGSNLKMIGNDIKNFVSAQGLYGYNYIYYLRNDGTVWEYATTPKKIASDTTEIYSTINTFYLLKNDGTVMYRNYQISGSQFNQVFTNPITYDTGKSYKSILEIFNIMPNSMFYTKGNYATTFSDIYKGYNYSTGGSMYVLLGEDIKYESSYSDRESDPEYGRKWLISHDPYYFDNSMGLSAYHKPVGFTANPPVKLDKAGKYIINLKARDNPISNLKFLSDSNEDKNYYKWSLGDHNLTVYVHRKPIALQRVSVTNNGNGTFTVKALDAGSYDPDHSISRADKGIAAREWRWREETSAVWTAGQMNKTDCLPDRSYITQLRVKDIEGVWSDYNSITIDRENPPVALFSMDKTVIDTSELLKVKDQSYSQSLSDITHWHWVVKKLNADGSVPAGNIQNAPPFFTNSNAGIGTLEGFDTNVKTNYEDTGPGKYRIYLRVKDSNGLWSDEGTDGTFNLDNFYYQDLIVQESFKMSDFRVVLIKDFRLEPYYNVNGRYPDKPMYVNSMAIDPENFIVGGYSIVPGFSSLTKGYLFEFEIDTTNFNEEIDTVEIEPSFYAYYAGVPGIRGLRSDLYWIDSNKEIFKAGEGGHSSWSKIVLNDSNRTITGEKGATWRGEYLIPATSWLVPLGTTAADAKDSRMEADIIVNFSIKGYKDGAEKFDYNEKQWPVERTIEKYPYEIGDVIRYDHTKSCLDDCSVIINRP